MFSVIFEVEPKKERWDEYLGLAKFLKPELERIDGFIDNERFGSRRSEQRVLSLSTWRDEKAVVRWRSHGAHHGVQEKGRVQIFADYRIRVGEVTGDTDGSVGSGQRFDETATGDAKAVTISEIAAADGGKPASKDIASDLGAPEIGASGVVDREAYESIYTPGKLLLLVSWQDAAAAEAWTPKRPAGARLRHRRVRIIRDYGMFDRREAPQYFGEVGEASSRTEARRRRA